jgi:hypothetical protein
MENFLCVTCGTEYAATEEPPGHCTICEDERQYVGFEGQRWTTLAELRRGHRNEFIALEKELAALMTAPAFAIGQRALLVESPGGNILWDCVALLDEATVSFLRGLGGIAAIAISHPHYYTTMVEWSRAFGAPIYLHAADAAWVMRPDAAIRYWEGETLPLHDGLTLIRGGGHFDGGTMLYWPAGAEGKGALLSGDIIQVVFDRRRVSFMYSYPNLIPLGAEAVRRLAAAVAPFRFERIYGAFHPRQVMEDGEGVVRRSVDRYLRAISV